MFKKVYSFFFKGGYIVCINKGKKILDRISID